MLWGKLVAVEIWNRLRGSEKEGLASTLPGENSHAIAGWAVALAIVATSAWLAVNLDSTRSARRLEVLQDPSGSLSAQARGQANELLGLFYGHRDPQAALRAWLRATQASPSNPRYCKGLAHA